MKIDCTGRKLGFQFDPTRINYDLLMGREIKVSLDKVKDIEGNSIPDPIKFSKTIANVDVASASTTFDFTLHTASCSEPVDTAAIKEKVALELSLTDTGRINVLGAVCKGSDAVATVSLGAKGATSQRRLRSEPWSEDIDEHNSLDAFYFLLNATLRREDNSTVARHLLGTETAGPSARFSVSRMLLHPGEQDIARYSLDAKLTHEEEMILAAADGCDKIGLEHRQHVHLVENIMNETGAEVKEISIHITDLEEQMHSMDHNLEVQMHDMDEHMRAMDQKHHEEIMHDMDEHMRAMDQKHHEEMHAMDQHLEMKLEEILHQVITEGAPGKRGDSLAYERHGERLSPSDDAGIAKMIAQMEHEQHDLRVWLQVCSFLFLVAGSMLAVWLRKS